MDSLFGDDEIEDVLSDQERSDMTAQQKEHEIGQSAQAIFRPWVTRWYEGRYTQNKGHIIKVIKDAIRDGISPDLLTLAMNYLGNEGQPVTKLSLQFALSMAERYRKIHGFNREDLGLDDNDQANYSENIGYGAEPQDNSNEYVEEI